MAITNPQAVRFCNEKARVLADAFVDAYESAKAFVVHWDANALASMLPDTAEEVVDGAASDGRQQMTGAKVNALYTAATAMVTWFEAGNPSRITRLRTIAVNGRTRI